jgi:putative YhdH/YhfP family quinone oxidoreductase
MTAQSTFKAYLVQKDQAGRAASSIVSRSFNELPSGNVLIRVSYSSLNFKDALSATGSPGVTKDYPHVPGIDSAGVVEKSESESFPPGDKVLVTGYDLGTNRDGGFAEFVRVPSEWVVPLPEGLSLKECMILGTAGFTAALSLRALLQNGLQPEQGEVVVTGATGGVGSIAVALLAKAGFTVVASTGKEDAQDYLKHLGASSIIHRAALDDRSERPMLKSRWAGAIDTVGGNTLRTVIRTTKLEGSVAACGLTGGSSLNLTVFPFILRGINLLGIDSAYCPKEARLETWHKLATEWKPHNLEIISQTITLEKLDEYVALILKGKLRGRTVIEL